MSEAALPGLYYLAGSGCFGLRLALDNGEVQSKVNEAA